MVEKIILSNRVFELGLSGTEFHLIAALASFGDRTFSITVKQIAEQTGLSAATVNRTLPLLEGRRLLFRYAKIKNHRRLANSYRLNLPAAGRKRFFCLPARAIRELPSNALLVYAYLICRAGRNKKAYASEYQVAEELNISRTTVRNCTAKLNSDGWIGKEKRTYEKGRKTGAYRSFAYDLDSKPEKYDLPECAERGEMNSAKGICLPGWFAPYSEDMGLAVGQTDFVPIRLIFRPPKPQSLPP